MVVKPESSSPVTVTLTFEPEVEAGLIAKAQARGMKLQEYLQIIVENDASSPSETMSASETKSRHEAVRRMLEFGDKYRLSLGEPVTRALLHEDHRF